MARKKKSRRRGSYRTATTGRYVRKSHAERHPEPTVRESEAGRFAEGFIKRHPDTFHELSKR